MSKRFEIDMGLNASDVAKGAKDAESALAELDAAVGKVADESGGAGSKVDDFADKLIAAARAAGKSDDDIRESLRDMGYSAEDARRAVGKLGDEAKDAGRDGARSVDQLEGALKDAQRESEDLGDSVGDLGDKARDGMRRAEDGVKGFKEEAAQSARETAASFDGSFESIAELGQEVAANAFAGFGPAGVAAGIAVAGAGGVMIDSFNKVQEAAEEARDAAFSLAYDAAGALASVGYTERIEEWSNETEKYKQVTDLANATGWDQVDVIDALASGGTKLSELTDAFNGIAEGSTKLSPQRLWELEAAVKATAEGYLSGTDAAILAERANYNYAMSVGVATGETDALGNAIYRLPDDKEVSVNAHTERATEQIQAVEDKVTTLPGGTVTVKVDSSQWDNWQPGSKNATIRGIVRVANGPGGQGGITYD